MNEAHRSAERGRLHRRSLQIITNMESAKLQSTAIRDWAASLKEGIRVQQKKPLPPLTEPLGRGRIQHRVAVVI